MREYKPAVFPWWSKAKAERLNSALLINQLSPLSGVKHYLPEIDNAPEPAQDVAFDIQYNTGNIRSFGKFKKAYNANDVSGMAKESGRIIISKERNDDMKGRILKTK